MVEAFGAVRPLYVQRAETWVWSTALEYNTGSSSIGCDTRCYSRFELGGRLVCDATAIPTLSRVDEHFMRLLLLVFLPRMEWTTALRSPAFIRTSNGMDDCSGMMPLFPPQAGWISALGC